jgi:hypothetical protein
MWDNYLGNQLRRGNRNLLVLNSLLVLTVLGAALLTRRYLYNFFFGPFRVLPESLLEVNDPDEPFHYFIALDVDRKLPVIGKDVQAPAGTKNPAGGTVIAEYAILPVRREGKTRFLVIRKSPRPLGNQVRGYLTAMPAGVMRKVIEPLAAQDPQLKGLTHAAFLIDTTGFRGPGYWGVALGLPVLLLGLWNVGRGVGRALRPERHPLIAGLMRYGPPREVVEAIQQEVGQEGPPARPHTPLVTRSWLLRPTWFGFQVVHLSEVVWVYKKVTRHQTYFIPTGTSHAAVIHRRDGKVLQVSGTDGMTEQLLKRIFENVPWILAGFNSQLAALWNTNRPELLKVVEQRRQQYLQQQGEEGAALS